MEARVHRLRVESHILTSGSMQQIRGPGAGGAFEPWPGYLRILLARGDRQWDLSEHADCGPTASRSFQGSGGSLLVAVQGALVSHHTLPSVHEQTEL